MGQIVNIQKINEKTSLQQAQGTLIMHNNELFKYWDEGCTRYVYVNEDRTKVIKIHKERDFCRHSFNQEEVNAYNNASEEDKLLMVKPTLINGMIEMPFVTPIKFGGKRLTVKQRVFAMSCRNEVGWDNEGNLLCFDLDEFKKY